MQQGTAVGAGEQEHYLYGLAILWVTCASGVLTVDVHFVLHP